MWKYLLLALLAASPAKAEDETVNNAFRLCKAIDSMELASARCSVSGWSSSVTTTIDMNSEAARELCGKIAGMVHQNGMSFRSGWTLQIVSPYSNGNSIAYCNL